MPLTEFQREVLGLLKKHRSPNSYIAGGIAIHRTAESSRYSSDIDVFHDADEAVVTGAKLDRDLLQACGYAVQTLIEQPSFIRAVVLKGSASLKLEWARDTAFRFFPVVEDDDLGYRLHDVDSGINKCLTLANRNAVRDIVDLIQLHSKIISLGAACWAACGKDPGFTPMLLVDCMRRNSIIRTEELAAEALKVRISAPELKKEWLILLDEASQTLNQLPAQDVGCLYLDNSGNPVQLLNSNELSDKRKHYGSVGGSWPRIVE